MVAVRTSGRDGDGHVVDGLGGMSGGWVGGWVAGGRSYEAQVTRLD